MADSRATRRGGRAATRRAAALAATAALTAALATSCTGSHQHAKDAAPPAHAQTGSTGTSAASAPERVDIPSIHVSAALDSIGLNADGTLQTPAYNRPMDASWYRQGPAPGEPGAAVIAGHLDTRERPQAVFYHLGELTRNQQVDIRRQDGTTAVFLVDSVATFKKDAFPSQRVYGATDRPELRLITCGGHLNAARHWDSNVVVFAHLKT